MDDLEGAIDELAIGTGFSGVVRVDRDGQQVLAKAYGWRTAAGRSPTRPTPGSGSPAAPRR